MAKRNNDEEPEYGWQRLPTSDPDNIVTEALDVTGRGTLLRTTVTDPSYVPQLGHQGGDGGSDNGDDDNAVLKAWGGQQPVAITKHWLPGVPLRSLFAAFQPPPASDDE